MRWKPIAVGVLIAVGIYFLIVSAIHFIADRRDLVLWDDEWLRHELSLTENRFEEACEASFPKSLWYADIRFIYFSMNWGTMNTPLKGGWMPAALLGGIVSAVFSLKSRWRFYVGALIVLGTIGAFFVYGWIRLITICLAQ